MGNIQVFKNLTKENLEKEKDFNVWSNKLVLEMNKDTTKYKVSRA